MIRFWAIIENTFREGIAKKTIITLFVLNTIIIGIFLLALNVAGDVMLMFGQRINGVADEVLRRFEAGVTGFFYQVAIFIGIFAVAAFYPSMQEKGTIDLLLSRPMSRFSVYTAKFLGCMIVVALVVSYLVLGTWAVFWLKTGIAHPEYVATIPIFLLIFTAFMAFIALVGVISRSTTLSAILGIFVPYIFSYIFYLLGNPERTVLYKKSIWYFIFNSLYWAFPKTFELVNWNFSLITLDPLPSGLTMAIWSTLAFTVVCYGLGAFVFQKRSY